MYGPVWSLSLTFDLKCFLLECSLAEFHCGKGVCIPTDLVCDDTDDCTDGRDELRSNCKYSEYAITTV